MPKFIIAALAALLVLAVPATAASVPFLSKGEARAQSEQFLVNTLVPQYESKDYDWTVKSKQITSCKRQKQNVVDCRYKIRASFNDPEFNDGEFSCKSTIRVRESRKMYAVREIHDPDCSS